MTIESPKDARARAVASIERGFAAHRDERIGNVVAGGLLAFFLEEIAPVVDDQAVAEVQERLQARVAEVDIEPHATRFDHWRTFDRPAKKSR